MNKFIFVGRLANDPDYRTKEGLDKTSKYATFNLAIDRSYKKPGEPTADFFLCTTFGRAAEAVAKWLHKGVKICGVGEIHINTYTDKKGVKKYSTQLLIQEWEFAEKKSSNEALPTDDIPDENPFETDDNAQEEIDDVPFF